MLVRLFSLYILFARVIALAPASDSSIRPLTLKDVNFLHTTDTHGWYSGHLNQQTYSANWGDFVSFAAHLKNLAQSNGQDLLLVDSGDRHDGNGLSDITEPNGLRSLPIFIQQHYDIVTLGNHELYLAENSQQEVDVLIPHYKENYVCSNVEYLKDGEWVQLGNRYRYFTTEVQRQRVLALSFLFDFNRNNDKTRVTPIAEAIHQPWLDEVFEQYPADAVDLVVVVGHIPVDRRWSELGFLHARLRDHYPGVKIQYFGGHSHIRDFVVYDALSTGLQSGRFCETVGFLSVDMSTDDLDLKSRYSRSYIDFNKDSFLFHAGIDVDHFDTDNGTFTKHMIDTARKELKLDKQIGVVSDSNYYMDYVPLTHPKNLFCLLTDKVLPSLEPAEADLRSSEERLIIINTGSVRYDLYKGPYTIDTHYIISPFKNDWVKVTLPKRVAIQIAPLLNRKSYILSAENDQDYLRPPHQRYVKENMDNDALDLSGQNVMRYPGFINSMAAADSHKLSKGYVTVDDFGSDGDDTPHKAVVNYPIPNVVQSQELKSSGKNSPVDVVFYSFIESNIKSAVEELGHEMPSVEFYSDNYLGLLLNDYVAANKV